MRSFEIPTHLKAGPLIALFCIILRCISIQLRFGSSLTETGQQVPSRQVMKAEVDLGEWNQRKKRRSTRRLEAAEFLSGTASAHDEEEDVR
jgi:hypothetical protein